MDKQKVADRAHQLADAPEMQEPSRIFPEGTDDGKSVKKGDWSTAADKHLGIADEKMRREVEDDAVERRAKIIARHRREWDGVRNLVYQAIRSADFDQAKLAKITAEAIRIVQDGERKAWDLDRVDEQPTIIIERHSGNRPVIRNGDRQAHA